MTLTEYLIARNGYSRGGKKPYTKPVCYLTDAEIKAFGIETKSGWPKRYGNMELPKDLTDRFLVKRAYDMNISKTKRESARNAISGKMNYTDQKVYLMKNSLGLYKIGIAKDPAKRASSLSCTSGIPVQLIAFWEVEEAALTVERHLHSVFKSKRQAGEWFRLNSYCIPEIEANMFGNYERVYLSTAS